MRHARLDGIIFDVPDDASLVYVAWVRDNKGYLNAGSNLAVFAEPVPEDQLVRLCDHVAVSSGHLPTQLRMTPGATIAKRETTDRPEPTVEDTLIALKDLLDSGKLKRVDVSNYLDDKEQEEFENGNAKDS